MVDDFNGGQSADVDISSYEREMLQGTQHVPLVAPTVQVKSEDLWLNDTRLQTLNIKGLLARVQMDRNLSQKDKSLKKLFLQYIGKHIQNPRHFYEHWRQIGSKPSWFHKAMALFKPDEITPEQKKAITNFVSSMTMYKDMKKAAEEGTLYNESSGLQSQYGSMQNIPLTNQGIGEYNIEDDEFDDDILERIDKENRLRMLEQGRSVPERMIESFEPKQQVNQQMAPPTLGQQTMIPTQQPQQMVKQESQTSKLSNILFNPNRGGSTGIKIGGIVTRKQKRISGNKFDRKQSKQIKVKRNSIDISGKIPKLEMPKIGSRGIDIKINVKGGLPIDGIRQNIKQSKLKPFKIKTSQRDTIMRGINTYRKNNGYKQYRKNKKRYNKKYNEMEYNVNKYDKQKKYSDDFGIGTAINKAMNIGKLEFKEAIMIHDKAYKGGESMKNSNMNLPKRNLKIKKGSLFPDIKGLGKVKYNFNISGNKRGKNIVDTEDYVENIEEFYEGDE